MTPEQFCYWLQGRAELQPTNPPSAEQVTSMRERIATGVAKAKVAREFKISRETLYQYIRN